MINKDSEKCDLCNQWLDAEPAIDGPTCYTCRGIELTRLKAAVQLHHDQRGDNRCYLDDLKLYHDVLGINPDPYVTAQPPEADMTESCARYRRQRQCPEVAGTYPMPYGMTIQQLSDCVTKFSEEFIGDYSVVSPELKWWCFCENTKHDTKEEAIQTAINYIMKDS
jgi:hypothetical protein